MSLRIMTNESAFAAQRNLESSSLRLASTMEKLSSGSRINRASDDAAGLAISDSLRATIRSMDQAVRNAQDGISYLQVLEGGANEISNMLIRLRELAMQAGTDTVGEPERKMINLEATQLTAEIDRMAQSTRFGGSFLLNGTAKSMEFQVGPKNEPETDRVMFDGSSINLSADALGVDGVSMTERDSALESLDIVDEALMKVNNVRAQVGALQSRLNTTVVTQQLMNENYRAANSRIRDTDLAVETTNVARETLIRNSSVAMLAQANQTPAVAISLLKG